MENFTWFDCVVKIATVLIAATNAAFVIYFLIRNYGSSKADKEKDRRIQWIKTLILDHSLKHYYSFFDSSFDTLSKLIADEPLQDEQKQIVMDEFAIHCSTLRKNFLDLFIAINIDLYNNLLSAVDVFQDEITISVFDKGVNLNHKPKCDELIFSKLSTLKTDVLRRIFSYNGDLAKTN